MTTRHRHERLALVIGIAAGLAMGAAHAQDAGEPPGEAYVDRIIAPQQLQELPPEEDELADTDGLPRSFHAEAIASRSAYGDDSFDEQGISVGGFRQRIGRAHVRTPVTNAHLVCRLLLERK